MRVGIVGCGFVGNAVANGIKSSVSVFKVDPNLKTTINDLVGFKPHIVFICVPTPLKNDLSLDSSIVHSVIEDINKKNIQSLIVLKSTVLPNHLDKISKKVKKFIYNPEFLREKSADEDFINSNLIVFGGCVEEIKEIRDFYMNFTKCLCKEYVETDVFTASLIKYSINSFLATKVTFFNELKKVFEKSGNKDSWEDFVEYIKRDPRIGDSHMSVPGHDGKEGFGGACLPKDSIALLKFFNENNLDFNLLKATVNVNNAIREKYNDDPREKEQRIDFKKNIT